jgi:hypothetical protein
LSLRVAGQKFITIPLMVVLTLMAASAANGGEYCKWTDESGVVHYDEQCPDNVTSAIVATEGERTESQIRAAEEHSKSLLSEPAPVIKPTRKSQSSESGINAGVTEHSRAQDSGDLSQMSADQLDVMCEKEREKRLAPEREQLIQNCIVNQRSSQEYCERYYSDYGAAQAIEPGRVRPALYMDLPECVAAWEARMKGN